jgi:cysteinyl-tRNA synthetase
VTQITGEALETRLSLFDTRSRTTRTISVGNGEYVRIYSCGPTVYRDAHVGNLRTFLLSDLIIKTLRFTGVEARLVQNITDVGHMSEDLHEDKLLAESAARKLDPFEIAREYERGFHKDLALLGVQPAQVYPRASESIEMMQDLISQLIQTGHAYVGEDRSVYFDARSFESYGEVSGNRLDALKPGHRFEYTDDGAKRFHADWALWKSAGQRTEMIWDSPWGAGFPGWHIECSAMSLHYLDGAVDLHLGGIDLRFPHHENERAQSNAAAGYEVVDHWVHGEHLLFEGRKMSKSAGNVVLVSDLMARGLDPLALRLTFLENRYRSQIDLTWDALTAADSTLKRWRKKLRDWGASAPTPASNLVISQLVDLILEDLGSADAIIELRRIERDEDIAPGFRAHIFRELDRIFSLDLDRREELAELNEEQAKLLSARAQARAAKDFAASDGLRDQLRTLGIVVKDGPDGQSYEITQ